MITSTTTPFRARRHRPGKCGACLFSALLDRVGSDRGCRCCRGQCGAPVGVLAYRAVCAGRGGCGGVVGGDTPSRDVLSENTSTPTSVRITIDSGRKRQAANKI